MNQSLADVLADLILAENLINLIKEGAEAIHGEEAYIRRDLIAKMAKRSLPAIAGTIETLKFLKDELNIERDSTNDSESKNKADQNLRDDGSPREKDQADL